MKTILFVIVALSGVLLAFAFGTYNFYALKVKDINGELFKFEQLKGKKIMFVNTASECGYTPQYKELEELYQKYKDKNFIIIGFPANNFGEQEPGKNSDIKEFCSKNYGVSFPLMAKSHVVGDSINPVYRFLTLKELNQVSDATVKWNFNKFLVDENGKWVAHKPSKVSPLSEEITNWIEGK
jgi:glutathione peroxidase